MSVARSRITAAHFPLTPFTKSPMECVGQPRLSMACNLLEVPGLSYSDFDEDEGEVVIGIRPRFSPQPRRKSSISDDDSEPDPPYCSSRRVSFADAKGLSLVQVKEFDTWAVPKLHSSEGDSNEAKEYYLSPLTFTLPLPTEKLLVKVRDQKVELESIELLPGTTILKGVIRVLNISFSKTVYVRTTLDAWSSHFDLLAEYNPGSSDGLMDCFSFMLTLVPPFGEQGIRVDFCLRYETPVGTFWANNNHRNYVLFCHQKMKDRPQKDNESKKGCLKAVSQIYPSEENISGSDASSQESISADELKLGEEVNSMKASQSSDDRSITTAEGEQKLETENRPLISRRRARKAARLARVRDHFAQRSKEGSDTERDETPPEVKQTAQEEKPQEEHSNVPPFSEENSKSDVSSFASNSMGVRKSLVDVPRDFLQASHNTASNEPEKCESNEMDDLATGGVSVTEIPDNPLRLNDQRTHAERQNVTMSVSGAEEESQMQNTCHGPVNNTAPDPVDSVTSSEISENPVGQNNRFTFGTVVAPLYHQMLGREGSERQSTADRGSPVRVTLSTGDWRKESCSTGSTGVGHDTVQGNVMNAQESNQSPSNVEEQRSDSVMAEDVLDPPAQIIQSDHTCTNTAEDPIIVSGDTEVHQHCGNILSTDTLSAQIPPRRLHLRGKSRGDTKPCDFQNQTTAERKIETNINETVLQTESQQVRPTIGPSFTQQEHASSETHQETRSGGEYDCQCVNESNSEADIGKDDTESITNSSPKLDNLLEASYDLNSDQIHRSDFSTPGSCQETKNETSYVEEQNKMTNHEDESQNSAETEVSDEATCDDDMFVKLKDEDSLIDESRSAFLKQEHVTLADTTDVKKWEMMVDEEERTILLEAMRSDTEADQGGQLEDTVIGTTLEKERGKTHGEVCEALTAAGVYDGTAEDAVMLEDKGVLSSSRVEEEETLEAVGGIEYVQATQTVTTAGEDGQTSVQEVKKIVIEEEIKTREEKTEDEEIIGDEAGNSGDVNAESVGITTDDRGDEVRFFEGSLDITQNNGEDALSPMMNSVQKKRVTGRDRERVNAHIPPEIDLYNEEDFQSSEDVTHDRSQGDCSVTDEPESDQTNHNSASSESDSDDEVELYMHCLRAVHTGAQATKDNDTGFSAGKRGSISRRKSLPTPMPSICESLDEEPHFGGFQDNHEDLNPAEFQPEPAPAPAPAAPSVSSGQESNSSDVSWWKETFSCSNVSKTLLYTTLLVAFLVVACHYDFLACFVLYLISIVWLYCQREQQPSKNNSRME